MKTQQIISINLAILATIILSCSVKTFAQNDTIRPVHVGLIYPISSNGLKAADYTNRFSLHAIAGVSKNETALTISGVGNLIKQNASGLQIAGAANVIGNNAEGAQIAGTINVVKNESTGAQVAGFMNFSGKANGLQIAGFSNISGGDARAVQVSGFLNVGKNVNSQVSGFMNIARNVKGIQLSSFINIADSSDYPIGLLNFVKNGERTLGLSIDETLTSITSFRSGGRVLYGIVGVGYNFKNSNKSFYGTEAGLGAHIPVIQHFRINTEIVNQYLSDFKKGTYMKGTFRLLPGYQLGNRLEIFAGPTFNYVEYSQDKGYDFIKKYVWSKNGADEFQGLYFGFNAGINVRL